MIFAVIGKASPGSNFFEGHLYQNVLVDETGQERGTSKDKSIEFMAAIPDLSGCSLALFWT